MEEFPEGVAQSIGVKSARGGEFGGGFQNAGHDHGDDQIEFAAGMLVDESVEPHLVQDAEDRGHVAVRAGADDVEGLRKRRTDGSGAFEDRTESVELGGWPMREVGEGAVANLAVKTKGLAEEDRGGGVAVGDGGHIHAYIIDHEHCIVNIIMRYYMTTTI
jgi:hypothetical protein